MVVQVLTLFIFKDSNTNIHDSEESKFARQYRTCGHKASDVAI